MSCLHSLLNRTFSTTANPLSCSSSLVLSQSNLFILSIMGCIRCIYYRQSYSADRSPKTRSLLCPSLNFMQRPKLDAINFIQQQKITDQQRPENKSPETE